MQRGDPTSSSLSARWYRQSQATINLGVFSASSAWWQRRSPPCRAPGRRSMRLTPPSSRQSRSLSSEQRTRGSVAEPRVTRRWPSLERGRTRGRRTRNRRVQIADTLRPVTPTSRLRLVLADRLIALAADDCRRVQRNWVTLSPQPFHPRQRGRIVPFPPCRSDRLGRRLVAAGLGLATPRASSRTQCPDSSQSRRRSGKPVFYAGVFA